MNHHHLIFIYSFSLCFQYISPSNAFPFFLFTLKVLNTLNAELNPICHLLALLEAHHILHVSSIRVKGKAIPIRAWTGPIVFIFLSSSSFSSAVSSRSLHFCRRNPPSGTSLLSLLFVCASTVRLFALCGLLHQCSAVLFILVTADVGPYASCEIMCTEASNKRRLSLISQRPDSTPVSQF